MFVVMNFDCLLWVVRILALSTHFLFGGVVGLIL